MRLRSSRPGERTGRSPAVTDPGSYPLRISPGAQVVVRPRGTGVVTAIIDSEPPTYVVRFPAGDDAVARRDQLTIRKQAQQASLGPARDTLALVDELLDGWVIYRCV